MLTFKLNETLLRTDHFIPNATNVCSCLFIMILFNFRFVVLTVHM